MARAYTVATAALALQMPVKWVDNALSHHKIPGVHQQRQGVPRRLTVDGLLILTVASTLVRELGVPLAVSLQISQLLIRNDGHLAVTAGVRLEVDLKNLRATLLERLERAVEIAPIPKRGRPAQNRTGRLN
jgi:hypothetical protein